jgi:hypothetical protein
MRIVFFEVTDWERVACERPAAEHSVTCVEGRLAAFAAGAPRNRVV